MNSLANKSSNSKISIIVLGDKETGKTNILSKYTKNRYEETYIETLGADFYNKEIKLKTMSNASSVTLNLWDSSSREAEYKILPSSLYKNANGFLICCSYDKLDSLYNIKSWLGHIKKYTGGGVQSENFLPVFILFNKFDLPKNLKKFGKEEIRNFAKDVLLKETELNIKVYLELSAKENTNIDYIFNKMINLTIGFPILYNSLCTSRDMSTKCRTRNDCSFEVDVKLKKTFTLHSQDESSNSLNNTIKTKKSKSQSQRSSCCN